ncbi:hypothetical protein S40293_09927 [Stachybotrys chartarum IBT 40293]|nr:hypothetical protein S40293_09927 [Stachybotrys chartarum IBT 40293]
MPKRNYKNPQSTNGQNRLRAYAACIECRRRKRKCDGQEPCSSCQRYGYNCAYHEVAPVAPSNSDGDGGTAQGHNDPSQSGCSGSRRRTSRHSPVATPAASHSDNILVNRRRGRLINAHSAVALPHIVGSRLDAETPPRLHSFAWNIGIRRERKPMIQNTLTSLITLEECRRLSSVYFIAVHPMFPFLSPDVFLEKLQQNWNFLEAQPNFAAVVAAVAALGSYFAEPEHCSVQQEESLVRYSFSILDSALSAPVGFIDLDSVSGWILRTIYVRLTTRPAVACISSQTAMHMAEMIGLHRELPNGQAHPSDKTDKFLVDEAERDIRRQQFWTASFSRRRVYPPALASHNVYMDRLVSLVQILDCVDEEASGSLNRECIYDLMMRLQTIPSEGSTFVSVFKAEICLGILRRFISISVEPTNATKTLSISIIQESLEHIPSLLAMHHLWWNLISVPFQTVCVCLYIDEDPILALLPTAMNVLGSIVDLLDSHLAREALSTAQQLTSLSRDKTNARLELKNSALGDTKPGVDLNWPSCDQVFGIGDWPSLDFLSFQ